MEFYRTFEPVRRTVGLGRTTRLDTIEIRVATPSLHSYTTHATRERDTLTFDFVRFFGVYAAPTAAPTAAPAGPPMAHRRAKGSGVWAMAEKPKYI
jgi:hypothetical protein